MARSPSRSSDSGRLGRRGYAAQAAADLTAIEAARQDEQRKADGTADVRFLIQLVDNAPEFYVVNVGRAQAADVSVRPVASSTGEPIALADGEAPVKTLLAGQELRLRRPSADPLPPRVHALIGWSDFVGRHMITIEAHVPVSDDQARAITVVATQASLHNGKMVQTVVTNLSDHPVGPLHLRAVDEVGVHLEQHLVGLLGPHDSTQHTVHGLRDSGWIEVEFVDFRGYSWVRRSNGRLQLIYPDLVTEFVTDSPEQTDTRAHREAEPDA